jgi:hypothetical protein
MASDQIRQMVNFILQEAHEKANEIRVKVGRIFFFQMCSKMTVVALGRLYQRTVAII